MLLSMVDIVDIKTRSRMMAGIRGKDTKPEMLIRHGLHARGYRYRLHDKKLPGKPDLVFAKYSAVIFVNGCFWHGHNCHLFKIPKSNTDFWSNKIARNRELDAIHEAQLVSMGWRIGVIWECTLKGKTKVNFENLLELVGKWLESSDSKLNF